MTNWAEKNDNDEIRCSFSEKPAGREKSWTQMQLQVEKQQSRADKDEEIENGTAKKGAKGGIGEMVWVVES